MLSPLQPGNWRYPGRRAGPVLLAALLGVLVASMALSGIGGAPSSGAATTTSIETTPASPHAIPADIPTSVPTPGLAQLAHRLATDTSAGGLPGDQRLLPNLEYSGVREGPALVPS